MKNNTNNKKIKKLAQKRTRKGISILQIQVINGWSETFVQDLENNSIECTKQDLRLYKEAISKRK